MRRNGHGPKWVGSLRLLVSQPFILRSPLPSDPEGRPKGGSDGNDWWTKWQGVYLPVLLRSLPRIVWMSVTSLPPFHSYRGANVVSGAPVSEASRIWKRKSLVTAGKNWTMMVIVRPLSFPSLRSFHSSRAEGAEWKEATRAVGFLTPYDRSSLAPAVWSGPVRHGHPLPCLRRRTGSRPTAPRGMEWVRRATVRSEPTWT